MTIADIIGFMGCVPLLGGTYLLTTYFKRTAWSARIVGDVILATAGVAGGMWSVFLLSMSFVAIDLYGLFRACQEEQFHKGMGDYASYSEEARKSDGS